MADTESRAGLKLRAGLPSDNGLSSIAPEVVNDTSRIVYFVAAAKVDDVVLHVDADSKTAVLKYIGIEAELLPDEVQAVRLILDRARVRRTGEQPLFDDAAQPEDVGAVLDPDEPGYDSSTVVDVEVEEQGQPALTGGDRTRPDLVGL